MKKLIIACLFTLISHEIYALDFMCRSLDSGNLLTYKSIDNILYYKDRFGNELNAWAPVEVLETQKDLEYFFEKEKILILDLNEHKANALFTNDASFQCRLF